MNHGNGTNKRIQARIHSHPFGLPHMTSKPSIRYASPSPKNFERPVMVTGGAGFIGTNLARRLIQSGRNVLIYDNLSRPGVEKNLQWLMQEYPEHVKAVLGNVRDEPLLREHVQQASAVFHLAAQVAVTTSLLDPRDDFNTNACGTMNVIESIRALKEPIPLIFTSTNKVYGGLDDVDLVELSTRYEPEDPRLLINGIDERRPLDFHSPYGCSKGTADQYILDYARTYGIPTVVFRMSCIYGPHQFGTEDQGWVAHFLISAIEDRPIIIYGDGKQVRDVLFVEDLARAFLAALENAENISGQAFNIGGGPANTISLVELLELIRQITGKPMNISHGEWRPGDQRYYVSDTSKFTTATGWRQQVNVRQGVQELYNWLLEMRSPQLLNLAIGDEP